MPQSRTPSVPVRYPVDGLINPFLASTRPAPLSAQVESNAGLCHLQRPAIVPAAYGLLPLEAVWLTVNQDASPTYFVPDCCVACSEAHPWACSRYFPCGSCLARGMHCVPRTSAWLPVEDVLATTKARLEETQTVSKLEAWESTQAGEGVIEAIVSLFSMEDVEQGLRLQDWFLECWYELPYAGQSWGFLYFGDRDRTRKFCRTMPQIHSPNERLARGWLGLLEIQGPRPCTIQLITVLFGWLVNSAFPPMREYVDTWEPSDMSGFVNPKQLWQCAVKLGFFRYARQPVYFAKGSEGYYRVLINPAELGRLLVPHGPPNPRMENVLSHGVQFALDVVMGTNREANWTKPSNLGHLKQISSGLLDPGLVGFQNVERSCFAAAAYQALLSVPIVSRLLADDSCDIPLRAQLHGVKRPLSPVSRSMALLDVARDTLGAPYVIGQPADAAELLGKWLATLLPNCGVASTVGTSTCTACSRTTQVQAVIADSTLFIPLETVPGPTNEAMDFARLLMRARLGLSTRPCPNIACPQPSAHWDDTPFSLRSEASIIAFSRVNGDGSFDQRRITNIERLLNEQQDWNHVPTAILMHNGGGDTGHYVTVAKDDQGDWYVFDDSKVYPHQDATARPLPAWELSIGDQAFHVSAVVLVRRPEANAAQ